MTDYTIEAETMALSGYNAVSSGLASNGGFIESWTGGSAFTMFQGEPGVYGIDLSVFDENDGASTVELVVNGQIVAVLVMDENAGGGYVDGSLATFALAEVALSPGDVIELRTTANEGEPARIDKIDFTLAPEAVDPDLVGETVTIYSETFSGPVDAGGFITSGGVLFTNSHYGGRFVSETVDMGETVNGVLSLDLGIHSGGFEALGEIYGDYFSIELIDQDGKIHVLDVFSGSGQSLIGSSTGQEITGGGLSGFSYAIPAGVTSFTIQLQSDISACSEIIAIDNLLVVGSELLDEPPAPPSGGLLIDAIDDVYVVQESEGAGDIEGNVLDNDVSDFGPVTTVFSVEGQTALVGEFIDLAGGGRVRIDENGDIDFDAKGDFDGLNEGQSASVSLEYTIAEVISEPAEHLCLYFNHLPAGTIVDDEFASVGLTISSANSSNPVMIFDTANPTGGDTDLATSNLGKVLILSQNGDSANPNDNYSGGVFIFEYDRPATVTSLRFLDVEEPGAEMRFFDEAGALITTIAQPGNVDGGQARATFNVANVSRMEVELKGSGAIDNLFYSFPAIDELAVQDTANVTIIVNGEDDPVNAPPVAADDTKTINEDEAIGPASSQSLNILDNDSDPDGDLITVSDVAGGAVGAAFAVTTAGGVTTQVRVDANGDVTFDTAGLFDSLAVGETDSFQLTYTAADPDGATDDAVVTITINGLNDPPTAVNDQQTIQRNEVIAPVAGADAMLNILANDSDPDGDPISIVSLASTLGTASAGSALMVQTASGKTVEVTVDADGELTFDTADDFNDLDLGESDSFTLNYMIADPSGGMDAASVTVTILGENIPPVAVDDAITIAEDVDVGFGGATLNVLDNDVDPDNDPLSVVDVNGAAPGAPVSVTTANGVTIDVVIQADGTLLFDPGDDFLGLNDNETDSFTVDYIAADSDGAEDSATVTVTIEGENDPVTGSDVNYNIVFLVDTSLSAGFAGGGASIIGPDNPLDFDGDGVVNTRLDAQLNIVQKISDAFDARLAPDADVELGVFGFSTPLESGVPNSPAVRMNDAGQILFDAGEDLTGGFANLSASDAASYNTAFAAANDFFAETTANDSAPETLNLVYLLSDGLGTSFTAGGDPSLGAELAEMTTNFGAVAETLILNPLGQFSSLVQEIEADAGDGTIQILDQQQIVQAYVANVGDDLIA